MNISLRIAVGISLQIWPDLIFQYNICNAIIGDVILAITKSRLSGYGNA